MSDASDQAVDLSVVATAFKVAGEGVGLYGHPVRDAVCVIRMTMREIAGSVELPGPVHVFLRRCERGDVEAADAAEMFGVIGEALRAGSRELFEAIGAAASEADQQNAKDTHHAN